ncbi:SLC13 family permease [Desulfoferrobacter suflitae]|uniref:SLC13 family permease n=1 Tax=Desulfoferrobacter suflitae TaxID=2865782 RepID=UPI00216428D9|nr:SLC13 family permease [Desulfoferrobacter suflitae]MCK8601647.1 SLC13 family permease [Desulfoferrobacter suflitae]
MAIWFVSLILAATIFLLITEKIPIDVTAVGLMVVLMVTRILSPVEALAGFANPAVITVGSMFMLSRGLMRTGALAFVSEKMIEYSRGRDRRILIMAMLGTALPSAFLNNTPVVVLFVSIIMSVCCEYGLSPSRYLIPVSFCSIAAGTCTLIGTSTNIIVSDLSFKYGYGTIQMFELSPLGTLIAILVIALLFILSPRLMPQHKAPVCELKGEAAPRYLAELAAHPEGKLIGHDPQEFLSRRYPSIELFELIRGDVIHFPERERLRVAPDDILFVKGTANDLVAILNEGIVDPAHKVEELNFRAQDENSIIVELIIPPESALIGEQPIEANLQSELGIQFIAVKRKGIHYTRQKLRNLKLSIGDVLLIHCTRDKLDELRNNPDVIVLEDIHHRIVHKKKAPIALVIFAAMIAAASTGLMNIVTAAVTAVFLMIITKCLHLRDAYRSLDVKVLLLIIGTIALGAAMEKTGTARLYADAFLAPFKGRNPALILSAFILLTSIITHIISNNATAVLLLPIAISTALSLEVDPRPFIVGICFGASCCYASPLGYQTNLLVYGPGGYRFTDFLKLGIPMVVVSWLLSSLFIPLIWHF